LKKFIPVNKPSINKEDINSVLSVLKKKWISSDGPEVKTFENKFSKKVNRKYSIAVSNGTAALEIAIKALGIKKNDEVIIPNFTIISNALSVIRQNAKPVLIDCDLKTWNMKIKDIEKKINKKTKAIIITHIYSFSNDMDKILRVCKKHNISVIEDAAEVIGLNYKKKMCGSFGDISTFSFYANKPVTTGEGGMISTNRLDLYNKCKSLRNLCFGKKQRFNHDDIGWNYRLTNVQAAIGYGQLKNISWIVRRKREIGKLYYKLLKKNNNIIIQPLRNDFSDNIFWVYGVVVKNASKITRDKIVKLLHDKKIQTRNFFYPMHKQKIFKKLKVFSKKKYPIAEYLSSNGFYLPSGLGITNKEIIYVANTLNKITNNNF